MEEFIVCLYWYELSELPIAKNILITNKETSCEEMQAFFYRAILCRYNSLFVVEINDSFTIYQLSKMCFYIHKLLSYKYCEYNKDNHVNILENSDKYYMNSCLVFVYEENYKYLPNFLKEIINYNVYYFEKNEITIPIEKNKNNLLSKLGNIKLISSDVSGLGKSQKIKKIIKDNKKNYFYFPLGGNLTKNNIFSKLENLLNIIKNINYQDIAIHLDLTESKEYELINEFFFAFLITKFYIHSENILYIPKDIYIYIEIPNCFENYLSKFKILNLFKKENITFENIPNFDFPDSVISKFNLLGYDSNNKINQFIKENIGINKYSFHQINIFIKLFLSHLINFNTKIVFLEGNINVTEKYILELAKSSQFFINNEFTSLLLEDRNKYEENYINKYFEIYENKNNLNICLKNFSLKKKFQMNLAIQNIFYKN